MDDVMISSMEDMAELVRSCGFLPFSANAITGFSVEEHTPPGLWFVDGVAGPWEWKGPVIRATGCVYGKFFRGKPGFISREWFLVFANYRRDGYDFEARCEEGLVGYQEKMVYAVLQQQLSLVSKEWRRLVGMKNRAHFDALVARLQMTGYVVTSDFVYPKAKDGSFYGWGLARYTTPELYFGSEYFESVYELSTQESRERIKEHLSRLLPQATQKQIANVIG